MDSLSAFDDLYTAIEACLIYPDEVIDRLARAFYPAILACWNSEEGQREFAAWQAEQAHNANNEKQEVPSGGELPVVHIALVCGFSGCVRVGAPCFFTMLHHFLRAASGIRRQHGSESDAAHPGIVPIFCAGMPCKLARKQCHFPAYCPILSA